MNVLWSPSVLASLILTGVLTQNAHGASDIEIIKQDKQTAKVEGKTDEVDKFDSDQLIFEKREPIAFEKLPLLDPKTGKEVSPQTKIVLDDGTIVEAGAFYQELFSMEEYLNNLGYQTRDTGTKGQDKNHIIAQVASDSEKIKDRIANYRVLKPSKLVAIDLEQVKDKLQIAVRDRDTIDRILKDRPAKNPVEFIKQLAWDSPNFETAGYGFQAHGDSEIYAKDRYAYAKANALVRVRLQNQDFYPLVARSYMGSGRSGSSTHMFIETLGTTLMDETYAYPSMVWDLPYEYSFYQPKKFSYGFGPISMLVHLSYRGSGKIHLVAGAGPVHASANLDANVKGKVTLSAWAGGAIGSVGATGEFTPVDDDLSLKNEIGQQVVNGVPQFCGKSEASNFVRTAIEGSLSAYYRTPVFLFWGGDTYSQKFVDAKGFHDTTGRTLYNFNECQPVYQ